MISKKRFIELIKFIKEQRENEDKFVEALEKMSPGTFCDCYLYDRYENKLLELIQDDLEDKEDDVGYFLYEMDYFNHDDKSFAEDVCPTDDKGNILYDSIETLYDYLISEKDKRHAN